MNVENEDKVIEELRNRVGFSRGAKKALAYDLGVSPQFLSRVLHSDARPSVTMGRALGFRKVVKWEPIG